MVRARIVKRIGEYRFYLLSGMAFLVKKQSVDDLIRTKERLFKLLGKRNEKTM
jgi:hypothetical protein